MKKLFVVFAAAVALSLILLPFTQLLLAQEKCPDGMKATADLRWRMEADGRDFNKNTGMGSFSALRTRVNLMWKEGDFMGYVQVQQSDMLGAGGDKMPYIHRAMLGKENCLVQGSYLYLGRMTVIYGDERLFSAGDWGDGNAFDGAMYGYKNETFNAEAVYAKLVERYVAPPLTLPVRDDALAGIWGEYTPLKLNAFFMTRKMASHRPFPGNTNWQNHDVRHTLGIYYTNEYPMNLGTTLNFAYQMGKQKTLDATEAGDVETDLAAWMLALQVWYNLKDMQMSPSIGAGIDMYTGDDPTTLDKNEAFDNLYAANHKFWGIADVVPFNNPYGLQDIFINIKAKPMGDNTWATLAFHLFSTSEKYPSVVDGEDATALGNELDFVFGKKMTDVANVEAGLGYFMPAEDWVGKDKDSGMWAYLQLQFTFGAGKCGAGKCEDCKK